MKILGVDHITINCREPEASFRFYEELLGLTKCGETDLGDHVLYYYGLPGVRLELIGYKEPQRAWETGNTDVGVYRHMALTVDDLDGLYAACVKRGVRINMKPTRIEKLGSTVMLIADPNGVEIELIQG